MQNTNLPFTGAHMSLGNIMKLSSAVTRSITAENVYGEKSRGGMAEVSDTPQPEVEKIGQVWERQKAARDLGRPWKVRPCINVPAGTPASPSRTAHQKTASTSFTPSTTLRPKSTPTMLTFTPNSGAPIPYPTWKIM